MDHHSVPTKFSRRPEWRTTITTIDAREIEQQGFGTVDELLETGSVHVLTEDRPRYVIVLEEQYNELVELQHEAYLARIKESLADVAAGRVYHFATTDEMMAAISDFNDEDAAP